MLRCQLETAGAINRAAWSSAIGYEMERMIWIIAFTTVYTV